MPDYNNWDSWWNDGRTDPNYKLFKVDECPNLQTQRAGDESYCWCRLFDYPCMHEYEAEQWFRDMKKSPCDEWNEIQEEWRKAKAEVTLKDEGELKEVEDPLKQSVHYHSEGGHRIK